MKVSELARRTGVSAHRLRRYEASGLLRAERGPTEHRDFAERTVREVTFIAMSRALGFSLKEIADVLPSYRAGTLTPDAMIERIEARIGAVDAVIAEQRALRRRLVDHIAWFRARRRPSTKGKR